MQLQVHLGFLQELLKFSHFHASIYYVLEECLCFFELSPKEVVILHEGSEHVIHLLHPDNRAHFLKRIYDSFYEVLHLCLSVALATPLLNLWHLPQRLILHPVLLKQILNIQWCFGGVGRGRACHLIRNTGTLRLPVESPLRLLDPRTLAHSPHLYLPQSLESLRVLQDILGCRIPGAPYLLGPIRLSIIDILAILLWHYPLYVRKAVTALVILLIPRENTILVGE